MSTSAQQNLLLIDQFRTYNLDTARLDLSKYDRFTRNMIRWQFRFLQEFNVYEAGVDAIEKIILPEATDFFGEFLYQVNLGDFYFYRYEDKNLEARDSYLKAYEIAKSNKNAQLMCEALKRLLDINRFNYLIENTTSEHYLEQYKSLAYDNYEKHYQIYFDLILGFQYRKIENWEQKKAEQLLNFASKSQFHYLNARIYQLIASYHDAMGNQEKSIELTLKSREQINQIEYNYKSVLWKVSQIDLIRYSILNGQFDVAAEYLASIDTSYNNKLEYEFEKYISFYKSVIDTTRGNYRSAYNNMLDYVDKVELGFLATSQDKLKELEARYQTQLKEEEIKAQQNQLKTQKQWLWTIAIFSLLLIVLLLGLFVALSKIRSKNQRIETLIRELHHRVKNNLQVISSLLGLQSLKLKDQTAKKAVTEGKDRIRAMSLVHQKLYHDEEFASLDMNEYLSKLTGELIQSYGMSQRVSVLSEISSIKLEADRALHVGLIVNELVSNAFKYAYDDIVDPKLEIKFRKNGVKFFLSVSDNGRGLPKEVVPENANSFGMKLITLLTKQLNAKMKVVEREGLKYEIEFNV